MIWLEVIDEGKDLFQLKKLVDQVLRGLKLPVENRAFKPHLTLARIREKNWKVPESIFSGTFLTGAVTSTTVTELIFFKSTLQPTGPIYTPLSRLELG